MRIGHLLVVTLVGMTTLIAGCAGNAESSTRIQVATASTESTAPPASSAGNATGSTGKPGAATTTRTTTTKASGGQPSSAAAEPVSISVVRQPTCPVRGTPEAPFSSPGTDVVIAWKVTGATKAALSVDNPKVYAAYGTYEASGQLSLTFPCDTTPGSTTHTYTVWPAGNKNVSKTISVSARNNV
jgi:hypothetical protein